MNKLNKKLIILIIVVVIAIGGFMFYKNNLGNNSQKSSNELTAQDAAQKAIEFINKNILSQGMTASLTKAIEENGVYKFSFKIKDQEYSSYVTKDGNLLFVDAVNLNGTTTSSGANQSTTEVTKEDKPDIKLFVMSYCPYGLQAEKMYLPVYNLLKDKADMGIYFVNYAMHEKKEIDENVRQYCIQKDQNSKYSAYLSCFVKSGNYTACATEAGVDKGKVDSCYTETDTKFNITGLYNDKSTWLSGQFPQFNVNADLNTKYGIQGSPTIVINGKIIEVSPRSPEKFKEVVCSAFKNPPAECSQTLSGDSASSGFGSGTGSSSDGSCE